MLPQTHQQFHQSITINRLSMRVACGALVAKTQKKNTLLRTNTKSNDEIELLARTNRALLLHHVRLLQQTNPIHQTKIYTMKPLQETTKRLVILCSTKSVATNIYFSPALSRDCCTIQIAKNAIDKKYITKLY